MPTNDSNQKPHPPAPSTFESPSCELDRAHDVVQFWRDVGPDGWFERNDEVDQRFSEMFYDLHFAAARRQCEPWLDHPQAALALILLLDQFHPSKRTGKRF